MSIQIRRGVPEDSYPAFRVFRHAIQVVYYQYRIEDSMDPPDEKDVARQWLTWQGIYDHLAHSAENFCVAEQDGQIVGYARTINRSGVRELTELFMLPGLHARGIGGELLNQVFPADGVQHCMIIATLDPRAQALYLQSGVYPWHPIYTLSRAPERVDVQSDLEFAGLPPTLESLERLGAIDRRVLGHRRDADHAWLLKDRQGFSCWKDGNMVGYGYLGGPFNGPFALIDPVDFPALLAHAETQAAESGQDEFGVDAPMINRHAVDYLLKRKFRIGRFAAFHMSEARWGNFENYLYTSPIFFM